MGDNHPAEASFEDICAAALRHYEKVSNHACSWMNTIPKAIEFYRQYGPGPLPRPGDTPEVKALREAAEDLIDDTPCRLDHHGYCQAHGWTGDRACPQVRLRLALRPFDERRGGEPWKN